MEAPSGDWDAPTGALFNRGVRLLERRPGQDTPTKAVLRNGQTEDGIEPSSEDLQSSALATYAIRPWCGLSKARFPEAESSSSSSSSSSPLVPTSPVSYSNIVERAYI